MKIDFQLIGVVKSRRFRVKNNGDNLLSMQKIYQKSQTTKNVSILFKLIEICFSIDSSYALLIITVKIEQTLFLS